MHRLTSFTAVLRLSAWRLLFLFCVLAGLTACQAKREAASVGSEGPPTASMPSPAAAAPPPPPPPPAPAPAARPSPPSAAIGHGSTSAKPTAGDASTAIPQFDWPPPKASAEESIPDKWLRTGPTTKLADVADKFEKALRLAHYEQRSYYAVPRGFALATQLEQIKADGTPMPGADRWKIGTPSVSNLSLASFIKALAFAPAGYYRAIVFVVTDASWVQSTTAPSEDRIKGWAGGGAHTLPASIGALPYGENYRARALIYEFQKGESGPAKTLLPSAVSGETHLDKGGIWEPLSIL